MPTKPKKLKGHRLTSPGQKKQGAKGRPKGTRLKRNFDETRLGFMLKYETPLEYSIIINSTKKSAFIQPDILVIELVCSASNDVSFDKPKFKRYLEEYREHGIHCDRPKKISQERLAYYDRIRRSKIKTYTIGKRIRLKKMIA